MFVHDFFAIHKQTCPWLETICFPFTLLHFSHQHSDYLHYCLTVLTQATQSSHTFIGVLAMLINSHMTGWFWAQRQQIYLFFSLLVMTGFQTRKAVLNFPYILLYLQILYLTIEVKVSYTSCAVLPLYLRDSQDCGKGKEETENTNSLRCLQIHSFSVCSTEENSNKTPGFASTANQASNT